MASQIQKIHMMTGKGGVGKSAVAAALAHKISESGRKTLLVELGERGFYSHVWGQEFSFQPTKVSSNLSVAVWSGEESLREYIGHLIRVQRLVDLIFENKIMKALVRAAPALNELAILGKLTSGLRGVGPKFEFEQVVVDCYATGHFKALINAPKGISEAITKGPMGEQSRAMSSILSNAEMVKMYVVTLPEELPVNESLELAQYLSQEFQQTPKFLLNKCLQPQISAQELKTLEEASQQKIPLQCHVSKSLELQSQFLQQLKSVQAEAVEIPHLWVPTSLELYQSLAESIPGDIYD